MSKGTSPEVSTKFVGGIDILFIDGGHTYDAVKLDFDTWFPRVKNSGFIVFHDYTVGWCGVYKFINEILQNKTVDKVEQLGSVMVCKRHV